MVMVQTTLEGARLEVKAVIIDMEELKKQAMRAQLALYGTLGILRRLGLPDEVNQAMRVVQRMISTLNMLRLTMIAVQAASGPIGWALALIGISSFALDFGDFMMGGF